MTSDVGRLAPCTSVALLAATLLLTAAPAEAFVLPADAILSKVAARRAKMHFDSLVLEGRRTLPGRPDAPVWMAVKPDKGYRLEVKATEGDEITLAVGRQRWRWTRGQPVPTPDRLRADLLLDFLGTVERDSGGKRGLAFCDAFRIDDGEVSLSRLGDRVAYVIGAKPWEADKPQLWIDKRLLVPIRLIEVDKRSGDRFDTRLLGFASPVTGRWWPRHLEVWKNGELVERLTFDRVKVNEPIEARSFDKPGK